MLRTEPEINIGRGVCSNRSIAPANRIRGLYAITPGGFGEAQLEKASIAALSGGISVLQFRSKAASTASVTRQCQRLRALCREFGTIFIINDNIDLAVETDADGVHIGRDDATLQMARRALGPDKIIGVSCYDDWSRAAAAAAGGADYLAFGSFYPSKTKPAAVRADMGLLRQAKQQFLIPVVAIGGIDLENAPQLIHEGADALAVISDLFGADDIVARAISYKKLFDDHVR